MNVSPGELPPSRLRYRVHGDAYSGGGGSWSALCRSRRDLSDAGARTQRRLEQSGITTGRSACRRWDIEPLHSRSDGGDRRLETGEDADALPREVIGGVLCWKHGDAGRMDSVWAIASDPSLLVSQPRTPSSASILPLSVRPSFLAAFAAWRYSGVTPVVAPRRSSGNVR